MSNKLAILLSAVIAFSFAAIGMNYILQDDTDEKISNIDRLDLKYSNLGKIETKEKIENVSNQVVAAPVSNYTAKVSNVKAINSVSGNKEQWMSEAGIPQSDWTYVDYIVTKESHWDPCAYNPSKSDCNATPTTACGLVQALPCSKLGSDWSNPVVALKWQLSYVTGTYGGYAGAYSFWVANGWY